MDIFSFQIPPRQRNTVAGSMVPMSYRLSRAASDDGHQTFFWQKVTPVIAGWFASHTQKNNRIAMAKAAFNKKKNLFTSKLDLNLRKKLVKCYIRSMALYGAETWTLRATDQKRRESFEMWCWRTMEKISWTDHVRTEEVLLRVNEQSNILHEIRKRKANWTGHILRRNCLLQQVIEGKIKGQIEVTRRSGRRRKKLLGGLKDRRGYCQLKEEALDRTMWRNRFGRGFGPVV